MQENHTNAVLCCTVPTAKKMEHRPGHGKCVSIPYGLIEHGDLALGLTNTLDVLNSKGLGPKTTRMPSFNFKLCNTRL